MVTMINTHSLVSEDRFLLAFELVLVDEQLKFFPADPYTLININTTESFCIWLCFVYLSHLLSNEFKNAYCYICERCLKNTDYYRETAVTSITKSNALN